MNDFFILFVESQNGKFLRNIFLFSSENRGASDNYKKILNRKSQALNSGELR